MRCVSARFSAAAGIAVTMLTLIGCSRADPDAKAREICEGFDISASMLLGIDASNLAWEGAIGSLRDQAQEAGLQKLGFAFGLILDPITGQTNPDTMEDGLRRAVTECARVGVTVDGQPN
jgi:hypothetical protein